MRILFFGSGHFAIPTLKSIVQDGHDVVTVVTQPDKVRGRGRTPSPTPAKAAAVEADVPVVSPANVNAPEVVAQLKSLKADLAYVAAFGQKIGAELLAAFPIGIINLHGSLLPHLRGAAPIQWAVINGLTETGVTIFRLVEKMDAGPIITQRRTVIGSDETAGELHDRLARIGCDAVRDALQQLAADPSMTGTPQDHAQASYAPKLKKSDGYIRFEQPAASVARRICGLWPWPGATCRFLSADGRRDELVTLARAVPYEGRQTPSQSPDDLGRITEMMSIQALDGALAPLEIKPAGGKCMSWQDYVNGRRVKAADRFVSLQSA